MPRADLGALPGGLRETRGAEQVAGQALLFRGRYVVRPALVNGAPGLVSTSPDGEPVAVMSLTISGGRITTMDILTDRDRLRALDLSVLG